MISFQIIFPETDPSEIYDCVEYVASSLCLTLYRKMETPDTPSEIPGCIVFYPPMGIFGALTVRTGSLSFRLEHPSHLSCDRRVKQTFFKFARCLREAVSEKVAVRAASATGHSEATPPFVILKPALPQNASGLQFGEGAVWDEWSVALGGARLWRQWREITRPLGATRKRETPARAFLEIGFGSGDFLAAEARAQPDTLFVGIESSTRSLRYAEGKTRDLPNVRLIHADAVTFLRSLCPPETFDGVYLHFPYPWDKRRHRHRRLIRRETLIYFEQAIGRRGFLQVVTDSRDYARSIFRLLRSSPRWSEVELKPSSPGGLRSRYLQKWLSEGRSIWTIRAQRAPEKQPRKLTAEWNPTLIPLSGTLCEFTVCGHVLPDFGRFSIREGRQVLRLEGVFREQSGAVLYRILRVGEDGRAGRVYLVSRPAGAGRFSVEIPSGGRFLSPQPGDHGPDDARVCPEWVTLLVTKVQEEALRVNLPMVYSQLLTTYGPQGWWPYDRDEHLRRGTDYRDEIAVGAILTQATGWRNVERALACLKVKGMLSLDRLARLSPAALTSCLQPTRFPGIKARRLLAFIQAFVRDFSGSWDTLKSSTTLEERRSWLCAIHGIGDETADSILCYALGDPVFVVDAYARRLYRRLGYTAVQWCDDTVRQISQDALGRSSESLAELHALIVRHAKEVCKLRAPLCSTCCLRSLCAYGRSRSPISLQK